MAGLLRTLSALALAALAVAAHAAEPLRLAVARGPVSLPVYVADARGLFAAEGVAVRTSECASGRACFQSVGNGSADLATAAEWVVTMNAVGALGMPPVDAAILAVISTSSRHMKLVARRSAGIAGPADLAQRRIGTVGNTSAEYFLHSWMLYNGLDPDAAPIRNHAPDALVRALQRGEIDAVAIWEPVAGDAIKALGADAQVLPNARAYQQHFSLVAARALLGTRDADLVKVLRALERAQRWIADDPASARRILRERLQDASADARLDEHDFRLVLGQSLLTTMEGQARWARRAGRADGAPQALERTIAPGPLRTAVPDALALVR